MLILADRRKKRSVSREGSEKHRMANHNGIKELKLSVETVRDFLLKNNGKVKQNELVNQFRSELSNISTKVRARQQFKDILQVITASKTENGEKYIVLTNQEPPQTSRRKSKKSPSNCKEVNISNTGQMQKVVSADVSRANDNHLTVEMPLVNERKISNESVTCVESTPIGSVAALRNAISVKENAISAKENERTNLLNTINSKKRKESAKEEVTSNYRAETQPQEKEWMLASSRGRLETLKRLLQKYPQLLGYKDFILGYTALHWGAKLGRADIVAFAIIHGIDINMKSHGGYTPLHIAASSGKEGVIVQLLDHNANIHCRDHSGMKPKDIVKDTVTPYTQMKLGRSLTIDRNKASIRYKKISNSVKF